MTEGSYALSWFSKVGKWWVVGAMIMFYGFGL
jgi:hypothetical protein